MKRFNVLAAVLILGVASSLRAANLERVDMQKSLIYVDTTAAESDSFPVNSGVILTVPGKSIKINAYVSSQEEGKLVLSSHDDLSSLTYYNEVELQSAPGNAMTDASPVAKSLPASTRHKTGHWYLITGLGLSSVDYLVMPQYEFSGSLQYHFRWPISIGPRVAYQMADVSGLPGGYAQKNLLVGAQIMSWSPGVKFGPYLGARYDFLSQGSMTIVRPQNSGNSNSNYLYSTLGWSYFGGLLYRLNSTFTVMGGCEIGDQTTNLPASDVFSPPGSSAASSQGQYRYSSKGLVFSILAAL